jgi:hypothetical protein
MAAGWKEFDPFYIGKRERGMQQTVKGIIEI